MARKFAAVGVAGAAMVGAGLMMAVVDSPTASADTEIWWMGSDNTTHQQHDLRRGRGPWRRPVRKLMRIGVQRR